MSPGNNDSPYKIRYRSILEKEGAMDDLGRLYYVITNDDDGGKLTVRRGDQFWDDENRMLLTVTDVKEKYSADNRGQQFGSTTTVVTVDTDHPEHDEYAIRADQFFTMVRNGDLIAHSKNSYVPEELQR